ncbi:synaptonemal complex protein 2-like [Colossoma macropomum]|uniref:synaptonemal complex protein 2-like n=1 Tax=Colossoma macropomum TaxID=42526 RepID=UPI0018651AF9|nr:synaptonemal complex protein 2-like [Colossoma macropomum]
MAQKTVRCAAAVYKPPAHKDASFICTDMQAITNRKLWLAKRLEDAFFSNNVLSAVMVILEEKSSTSLVDRLDEVASRELQKNEFKNVTLILRAFEQIISKDKDCINILVHQGVVIKMLNWFERVSEHLKMQQKASKGPVQLMEVFYEVSMSLCQSDVEDNGKILEVLLLRFGAVVIDQEVKFGLRLEAIKTINSMLDNSSKEFRRKICQSDDHNFLLEEFAKVIVDVGDYEMQVAVSEALCRMTPKKLREELVGKWFNYRSFASTFTAIRVKEFETDCRIFLNELNSYFGDSRRVFSFPCTRAFLDFTELFKPEDELLKEFWVDFNVGTSCISFFVHDPEGTLWELIHLPKEALCTYSLRECDDRKLLSVHMNVDVSHGNTVGKMVQIAFDSKYDIQTAVEKVFGRGEDSQLPEDPKHVASVWEDSGIPVTLTDSAPKLSSLPVTDTAGRPHVSFVIQSGPSHLPSPKVRRIQAEDSFCLRIDSDTEVARAKATIFGQPLSSNGSVSSVRSLPSTMSEMKSVQKRKLRPFHSESDSHALASERRSSKETPRHDYTRKKPRLKSKLKVLPLSSPSSSNEDEYFKESTPKGKLLGRERAEDASWSQSKAKVHSLDTSHPSKETTVDSGFQDKVSFEDTVFAEDEPVIVIEEQEVSKEPPPPPPSKRPSTSTELPVGSEVTETQLQKEEESSFLTLKPRRLFPSTSLESATALMEDEESETEMGSGVIAAFNTFKTQLREHFSSRYKKIEAKSLRSLTDCQKNVTSLLQTAHNQRLVHLEHFQDTVVQQLGQLEQNCLSLKNIEQETVRFWQSESDTVKAFCDKQQKRLDSLDILRESVQVPQRQGKSTEATASVSSDAPTTLLAAVPVSAETEKSQRGPNTVPAPTAST